MRTPSFFLRFFLEPRITIVLLKLLISQADYTVGGTFQDAIARKRAAGGLVCVTIDLRMVEGFDQVLT